MFQGQFTCQYNSLDGQCNVVQAHPTTSYAHSDRFFILPGASPQPFDRANIPPPMSSALLNAFVHRPTNLLLARSRAHSAIQAALERQQRQTLMAARMQLLMAKAQSNPGNLTALLSDQTSFVSASKCEELMVKVEVPPESSQKPTKPKIVESERSKIELPQDCKTPDEAAMVLKSLGSTFRFKADKYIDASVIEDPGAPMTTRGGRHQFFPDKLYQCILDMAQEGREDVMCFLPHGRAFVVHKPDTFEAEIMPKYFDTISKWSSFSRQLHLWGFFRVASGPDAGAYYHELFLRGHPKLTRYMRRVGAPRGDDRRKIKTPEGTDPDFYAMNPLKSS